MKRFSRIVLSTLLLGMLATPLVFEGVAAAITAPTAPTQTPNPVAPGGTASYSLAFPNVSSGYYVSLDTPPTMPSGATFSDNSDNEDNRGCVAAQGTTATFDNIQVVAGTVGGTFTVTATQYSSANNCDRNRQSRGSASVTLTLNVGLPFAVSVPTQSPSPDVPGGPATYSPITITGGTSGDFVAIALSSLPTGATPTVPVSCLAATGAAETPGFTGTQVTPGSVGGAFTVTVTEYTNSNCTGTAVTTATATPTLTVSPFTVSIPTQTTSPVAPGSSTTYTPITIANGLSGDYVALSATGATFTAPTSNCVAVSADGTASFTNASVTAPAVTGTFTITATEYTNSNCTSTAVTTATATPTLTVTALAVSVPTQTTNPVATGSSTTYTPISIANGLSGDFVKLTAGTMPTGATFTPPTSNCVVVSGTGTASFSNASVTAGAVSGSFTITATEYSAAGCTTSVTTATATPTLTIQAFAVAVPTQSPNPAVTGGVTTYTPITISGSINGDFVKLTAPVLPSGASFTAPTSNCVAVSGNAASFTNASVTPGTSGGSFTITATEYTNNTCTSTAVTTASATPTLTLQAFALTVPTQTTNPVVAGGSTTYTPITITGANNGDYVALAASSLPSGASFTPPTPNCVLVAGNGATLTGSVLATTAPGGSFTITAKEYSNSSCATLVTTATATATLSVSPFGPATQLAFSTQPAEGSSIQAAGTGTFAVSVNVEDANGNLVSNISTGTVTLSIGTNPGSGALSCSGGLTATVASGIASFANCAITKVGTNYKLTATSSPVFNAPSNATSFNITAGAATSISLSSGYNQSTTVGGPFSSALVARVSDLDGNPVPGATVTYTAPATGASGTFKATAGACVASGTATTSCTATTSSTGLATSLIFTANSSVGAYHIAVSSPGTVPSPLEDPMTNLVGAAAILGFVAQPSVGQNIQATGTGSFSATVAVEDASGNVETGINSGSVTLRIGADPTSGVLGCTGGMTSNVVAGDATFTGCSITIAGNGYMLSASSSPSYEGATNANAFNVTAATASQLVFVAQPTGAFVGTAVTPAVTVQIEDQNGNTTSGAATIALTPSASSISSSGSAVASGGVATFSGLTFSATGLGVSLSATSTGLTAATSTTFSVSVLVSTSSDQLTDGATDSGGSGMKSVTYYYCAGFSNTPTACGPSNGTAVGSPATTSPFSVAWSSLPATGSYRVVAVGADNAGNTTTSTTTPVSVDDTGPVAGAVSVPNYANALSVTITSTGFTDALGGMSSNVISRSAELSPVGGICPTSGYTGSTVVTSPDTGVANGKCYEYTLTGTSSAGQVSTVTSAPVLVDTTAPATTITLNPASPNGPNGWYDGTNPTFSLSASDTGGSGVQTTYYEIDGGTATVYPGSAATIPNGAAQTVNYWSVDNAGNIETVHTSASLNIDTAAPSGSISAPAPNASVSGSVTVQSNSTDSLSGVASAAFQYELVGGSSWTTIGTDTTSPFSVVWNASALSGQYNLRGVTTDNAGNSTTSASVTVTVTAGFSGNSNGTQVFPSSSGSDLYGNATSAASMSSSSAANTYTFTSASTLSNLSVTLSGTAQSGGSSASLTVTVMKNGAATALTCSIADNATTCTSPGPVSFASGNTMNIKTTRSFGGQPSPAITGSWTISHT